MHPSAPAPIIARAGAYAVLATAAQPHWADRSSLKLHQASYRGHHSPELYAVLHRQPSRPGTPRTHRWLVLDVRTLARSLAEDLPISLWRDQPCVVALTLQRDYPNAAECMSRILANVRAEWRHEAGGVPETPAQAPRFILQGLAA